MIWQAQAQAVSFDCKKASGFAEQAVCSVPYLGRLDDTLAKNYRSTLDSNIGDGARKELKTSQRTWLVKRNACSSNACVEKAYKQRIDAVCEGYPVINGVAALCTASDEVK